MSDFPAFFSPPRHAQFAHHIAPDDPRLSVTARTVEASFLSEMLISAGAGRPLQGFGGGIGEDQFASLLVRAQADRIAARGGIGLAEAILRSTLSGTASDMAASA